MMKKRIIIRFMKTEKRQYHATENRQAQLLESAAELISINGLAATTMPQIAAKAGLSVGGLYRHFRSKSELVAALVIADADLMAGRLASLSVEPATISTLRHWAQEQLTSLAETASFILRLEILALSARDAAVANAAAMHEAQLNEILKGILLDVSAPKSLGSQNPNLAIEMLASMIDGLATRAAIAGELSPLAMAIIEQTITSITSAK
jgi:AcrR family transcriptional regulator